MLRRDGNVIGSPIETTQSSGTGVFRIASGQQKQILAKFPEHVELPEKPSFVTCLRGRTPAYPDTATSTASPAGRYPNSALETGQILIRIASPQDWEDRSSSAYAANTVLEEERDYAGKATITGYSVEITMKDTGTDADGVGGNWTHELSYNFLQNGVLTNATRSAFGTIFLPIEDNVDCKFFTNITSENNNRNLPNIGTPFEDEDNVYNIILDNVTAGPVNRTGNTGLRGMPKDAYYSIRVFAENAKGASVSATESNEIDCTYDRADTRNYLLGVDYGLAFPTSSVFPKRPPGSYYLDFMLLGGGAAAGNVRGTGYSGGGGSGAMVIAYGYRLKKPEKTYNITIGTGGINSNGGNSSAFGCIAVGGGKGASAGRYSTAQTTFFVSAAQSGGSGGGQLGTYGTSIGITSLFNGGSTGGRTGNSSGPSYTMPNTEFDPGIMNVYENPGGGFQISAADVLRSFYSEQTITNVTNTKTIPTGYGGGGVGNLGGTGNQNTFDYPTAGAGKYIRWATPGICSLIPQVGRIPYNNQNMYNTIGRSPETNQPTNFPSNKGFFGAGGSAYHGSWTVAPGGHGLARFENSTQQSVNDGITYSANAIHGLGAGGGAVGSNNNDANSFFQGGNGGDGICIIRMARSAHHPPEWSDTFNIYYGISCTGSFQTTAVGSYVYFIFDGDGTFGPKALAGYAADGDA